MAWLRVLCFVIYRKLLYPDRENSIMFDTHHLDHVCFASGHFVYWKGVTHKEGLSICGGAAASGLRTNLLFGQKLVSGCLRATCPFCALCGLISQEVGGGPVCPHASTRPPGAPARKRRRARGCGGGAAHAGCGAGILSPHYGSAEMARLCDCVIDLRSLTAV